MARRQRTGKLGVGQKLSHNILCADKKDDGFSDKIFEEEALSGGKTYDIMTATDDFDRNGNEEPT
jgi:hypothetical protein